MNEPEPKEGVHFPIPQGKEGLQDKCFLKTQPYFSNKITQESTVIFFST